MVKRIPIPNTIDVELLTVDENCTPGDVEGCIVRLKPTAAIGEDELRAHADRLRAKALALKVLPRPAGDRLVLAASTPGGTGELPTNPRKFVLELAAQTSSKRKPALVKYLSAVADAEGL